MNDWLQVNARFEIGGAADGATGEIYLRREIRYRRTADARSENFRFEDFERGVRAGVGDRAIDSCGVWNERRMPTRAYVGVSSVESSRAT